MKKLNTQKSARFVFLFCWLFSCCHTETQTRTSITNRLLPNGKHLAVEKENREITYTGLLTKHNYGTNHSFRYSLKVDNDAVFWNGGSGEPKHLLFCSDEVFIHFLKRKSIAEAYTDTIDSTTKYNYHDETLHQFEKFVDNRYLFNWFGDAFWIEIPDTTYQKHLLKCDEYEVPNDNELKIAKTNY